MERGHFGSYSMMIKVGIMIDGRTFLHVSTSGSVTNPRGLRSRESCGLRDLCKTFQRAYESEFLYMDDNVLPHLENLVGEFFLK